MKSTEQNLIKAIENFQLDVNNIPVELIEAYKKLRQEFNKIPNDPQPVFTENNIPINMKNWEEWKFIGLNNWEFIGSGCYRDNNNVNS